ncbi:hypothetical protein HGRIS_006072 [Hohenbuehelia grisea]|uniref:Peptidase M20 domain-containing protein 2 n=1 Tax=Hohenbuehelia grisea TaxID=104357 RepID=A0ABR3K118_9AGAR
MAKVQSPGQVWRVSDNEERVSSDAQPDTSRLYRPDVLETIQERLAEMDEELRALSLDIHEHPELAFKESYAHDTMTAFMAKHGFEITRNYHLETAWKATFSHGKGGNTVGINSEMDALPGVGHACGHNLIGMSGIAVACALKAAMENWDISGKIVILGTPAEEGGGGKKILLEKGAYDGMDACLMCHPAPGPKGSVSLTSCLALNRVMVEFNGHTAHAALSPWEAQNALDAAVLSYNNISALRQQMKPTHRAHGIFEGNGWVPGIIPDYAKMFYYVRAPTTAEVKALVPRVINCFKAAALATGCDVKIDTVATTDDLRQNEALGEEVGNITIARGGSVDYEYWGIKSASTDFGDVTYALPSLHPGFAIPTELNGGNHTHAFAKSAKGIEAHRACIDVSIALAGAGVRILLDNDFLAKVKAAFEADKKAREAET